MSDIPTPLTTNSPAVKPLLDLLRERYGDCIAKAEIHIGGKQLIMLKLDIFADEMLIETLTHAVVHHDEQPDAGTVHD